MAYLTANNHFLKLGNTNALIKISSSFSTPSVTTSAITDISINDASIGGNVTNNGGITLTYRGICVSTNTTPTVFDVSVRDVNTGTGSYILNIGSLEASTHYHARAFAYNSQGTSYGVDVSFNTAQESSSPSSLLNGLVGFWKCDETSGTIIHDSVASHNASTNGITNAVGKFTRAVDLDNNDLIDVTANSVFTDVSTAFSISIWFNLDTLASVAGHDMTLTRLFNKFDVYIDSGNDRIVAALFNDAYADFYTRGIMQSVYSTGEWFNAIIIYSGPGIEVQLYLNSTNNFSSSSGTLTGVLGTGSGNLTVGGQDPGNTLDGKICSFGYWNRVLTSDERSTLQNYDYPFS